MELKYRRLSNMRTMKVCSNRTFMELKLFPLLAYQKIINVLIVPLWN